jgi:hypothetical protein
MNALVDKLLRQITNHLDHADESRCVRLKKRTKKQQDMIWPNAADGDRDSEQIEHATHLHVVEALDTMGLLGVVEAGETILNHLSSTHSHPHTHTHTHAHTHTRAHPTPTHSQTGTTT